MGSVHTTVENGVACVTMARGKVNAFNDRFVRELQECLGTLKADPSVRALILAGNEKFFSFGLDIPELLGCTQEAFAAFLAQFADFYTDLFRFPKPVVAALGGHTIAGGCMVALACDYRLMVSEKARIGLNEISFGSAIPAGGVEMLRYCVGPRRAELIMYSGAMYEPQEAARLGLVDQLAGPGDLMAEAHRMASDLAQRDPIAFANIKRSIREPVADQMVARDRELTQPLAAMWYLEETRAKLERIKILA